jgi:hypothetical protein
VGSSPTPGIVTIGYHLNTGAGMQIRLDQNCKLKRGIKDAIHVPFIVARLDNNYGNDIDSIMAMSDKLKPGCYIKFTNYECTSFVPCEKDEAHGIINPFLDTVCFYDDVVILLVPSVVTKFSHDFDIDLTKQQLEKQKLTQELIQTIANDSECGNCWRIKNNEIVRD